MQNIKKTYLVNLVTLLLIALGFIGAGLVSSSTAGAQGIESNICEGANLSLSKGDANSCANANCPQKDSEGKCITAERKLNSLIGTIVNILSVIVGIIAVIMIIIGGAKFITSGGDSGKVTSAKSTVIYAIIGLIIVALAQFIVRFVLSKV